MDIQELNRIANAMVAKGKGILAADESSGTIKKRFDAINVENTESNRRDYREFMFRTPAMKDHISGVILFDETIRQKAKDGTPLVEIIAATGAVPGIKVDAGAKATRRSSGRDDHRRPGRPARAVPGISQARRTLREMARDLRSLRRQAVRELRARQCAGAGALRRAGAGERHRSHRRARSADGLRQRHRYLRRSHRMGSEGDVPGAVQRAVYPGRHHPQAEHDRLRQEERRSRRASRKSPTTPSKC